jgi:predicted ATPase with chaperone activity
MSNDPPDYGADLPTIRLGATPARMGELPAGGFLPREPRSWEDVGVDASLVEQIILRMLAREGSTTGRRVAHELSLSAALLKEVLEGLKAQKLVQHRGATATGDFIWELTEAGRHTAIESRKLSSYVGPVPVPFHQYVRGVQAQTLAHIWPTRDDLARAFEDMTLNAELVDAIGPAISSGRALFLYGKPGNGKTSIAERVTRSFGDTIWIPVTLLIDGHIVKLYDPATHQHQPDGARTLSVLDRADRRWVRIERPTVIAGGELTLDMLEIQRNPTSGVCEAPLQLKANCGTLVIDDFGRQRIEPLTLLNRWIFPLERRVDHLRLPDGRKIPAPFEPLLIFSTNIEPSTLVDEAFLRRIPYKIRVPDPTRDEFGRLILVLAEAMDITVPHGALTYLLERHYRDRPMRFCHPRDLLQQVADHARYHQFPAVADAAAWDRAVHNYFSASGGG